MESGLESEMNSIERIARAVEKTGIDRRLLAGVWQSFGKKPAKLRELADWLEVTTDVTDGKFVRKQWQMLGIDKAAPDPSMPTDMETPGPYELGW